VIYALLLLAIIPHDPVVRDQADICEVERVYDNDGELIFTQQIWRDFNPLTCRNEIVAWRMVRHAEQLPQNGVSVFWDGDCLRRVEAKQVVYTWDQYDAEVSERNILPPDARRGLTTFTEGR